LSSDYIFHQSLTFRCVCLSFQTEEAPFAALEWTFYVTDF